MGFFFNMQRDLDLGLPRGHLGRYSVLPAQQVPSEVRLYPTLARRRCAPCRAA
jgi:hypothetical protein